MQVLHSDPFAHLSSNSGITGVAYDPAPETRSPSSVPFDPKVHLCHQPPSKTYTFDDLGLKAKGICPTAISEAFPLFTRDAVKELRKDCLSSKALEDFTFSSKLAACQAREFHPSVAPFACAAFSSPEFVKACSQAAGIELVPIMPLELAHTNFQVGPGGKATLRNLSAEPSPPLAPAENIPEDDGTSVVGWHHDSYPFVAVTMLSDVTNMIGGETAIETGDGTIAKIRGPELGWTVVMQGRYVRHLACKAYNASERITMVTSFRAKDVSLADESILDTIRPVTKKNRINAQWSTYRLRLVAERMTKLAQQIEDGSRDDVDAEKDVCNRPMMQAFVDEQVKYLQHGIDEMME